MRVALAMSGLVLGVGLWFGCLQLYGQALPIANIRYGDNQEAGNYVFINGVRLYYETYGKGDPLVLLHGNGGNINAMKYQIDYFAKSYQVIAMDCRGRGKSELGRDPLTYLQMTKDLASLLDYLRAGPACIVGRSDGGIIALMMGIYFPEKVKKIAAFGANLTPDAGYPSLLQQIHDDRVHAEQMIAAKDNTKDWVLIRELWRLRE